MEKLKKILLDKFIEIVPIENTFFMRVKSPKIKLTKETIMLNFSHMSPYKNGDVIFLREKNYLFIWFTKNKLDPKKIHIPEAFLIYKTFPDLKNTIITIKKENLSGIILIKDYILIAQIFKNSFTEKDIQILKKEHSLENATFKNISRLEIKLNWEVIKFVNSMGLNYRKILDFLLEEIKVPVIIVLLLVNIFELSLYEYTNILTTKKQKELTTLEMKNKKIKEEFDILYKERVFFKNFIGSEIKYPNIYKVLSIIAGVASKNNGTITTYQQANDLIDIWIVSSSPSSIVSDLISTKFFKNVEVISVSQFPSDNTKEVANLEINLKPLKNE